MNNLMYIAWIHWNPSADFIVLPYIGLPITWYGLLFAAGFWVGFHMFVFMFKKFLVCRPLFLKADVNWKGLSKSHAVEFASLKEGDINSCNALLKTTLDPNREPFKGERASLLEECRKSKGPEVAKQLQNRFVLESKYPKIFTPLKLRAKDFAEKLILYIIVATVVGSRLGHILFYENPLEYLANPLSILKTWEGGLASHGGILAVIFSVWLFHRSSRKLYPDFTWYMLMDRITIPTIFVCSLIRVGNFFNQEILGVETTLPWGVIFGHPADGAPVVPRHPAQLYEAAFYLLIFISLTFLWKKYQAKWEAGRFTGIAIFAAFSFRFFIEFLKTGQSLWYDQVDSMFFMGQVLSIPLALIGAFLILRKRKRTRVSERSS